MIIVLTSLDEESVSTSPTSIREDTANETHDEFTPLSGNYSPMRDIIPAAIEDSQQDIDVHPLYTPVHVRFLLSMIRLKMNFLLLPLCFL